MLLMRGMAATPSVIASQIALLLLVSGLFITPTFATTIVALVTDHEGILALDSKLIGKQDGRILSRRTTCKIITATRSLYAIVGLAGNGGALNAYKIIEPIATDHPSALLPIRDALLAMIQNTLPEMSDVELKPYTTTGEPLVSIFAIFFDKTATLHEITFFLNPDRSIRSLMPSVQTNPASVFFEKEKEMSTLLPPDWGNVNDKISLVKAMMSAGIAANRIDSADPISIVRVNAKGLEWIETGACQAQK